MQLIQKILNKINGLHYPQEYLCLKSASSIPSLTISLIEKNTVRCVVTDQHLFVGYNPLIFSFPEESLQLLDNKEKIILAFTQKTVHQNEKCDQKDAIAWMVLKKINSLHSGKATFHFFKGENVSHRLISGFHQYIISLQNRWFSNKKDNVFLENNLYKQVQIAYSVPRTISLITVGADNRFNLFPTDLHGQVGKLTYIISLRHAGKACKQVMDIKKIIISQIESAEYKTAYLLGKNHMQPLREQENFPFSDLYSNQFKLPLPAGALLCRELEYEDSFSHGIHQVMLFKIIDRQQLAPLEKSLTHIHNLYATWLYNNGLPGNYLLR